ncbi:MAG: fumarylacetoacetate hydrolase family protein [Planctomycetota bacterium]|nr:fumarylacetoacetate hydrolase family protein [Planctomycetota bacterium]
MRLCRYRFNGAVQIGFYHDDSIVPVNAAAQSKGIDLDAGTCLLPLLNGGELRDRVKQLEQQLTAADMQALSIAAADVSLLVPNANPSKLMLLAGNYSEHIEEGGEKAKERSETFPYVFMKPPLTTLTNPGDPVKIPAVSPDHVDWELELGIIIGRQCKGVSEADALNYVAGYTVVNDISDRKYTPNPGRTERSKDGFFDWLHGKWHDTFCPMGPCALAADEAGDPQTFQMTLKVNGEVEQNESTAAMVFPVAAVIAFISSWITLEPGDIISTGTPAGVGAAKNKFLKAGDTLEAGIDRIGVLRNPVE